MSVPQDAVTAPLVASTTPSIKIYTTSVANVRSCASTSCDSVGHYDLNTEFDLNYATFDAIPEWVQFTWNEHGKTVTGYISKSVLSEAKTQIVERIIEKKTGTQAGEDVTRGDVIKSWRNNTAYVVCGWDDRNGNVTYMQSGSGLAAYVGDVLEIITNKHVVMSKYGYPNVCAVKFPDDSMDYAYYNNHGTGSNAGVINLSPDIDMASIVGLVRKNNDGLADLTGHARSGYYMCKNRPEYGADISILGYPSYGAVRDFTIPEYIDVTATRGSVSGFDNGYYMTDAKIEHGNSGGVAIDVARNCYLGIPTWSISGETESLARILPASWFLK